MFKSLLFTIYLLFNIDNANCVRYTREQQMKDQYDDFLKIHKKHYSNPSEYQEHFEIFHTNLNRIKTYTDGNKICKMYLTKYSDITTDKSYDYDTCNLKPIFTKS